jgi:hypothetical protein
MRTSTGSPTKAEIIRIERMKPIGCLACAHIGLLNCELLELHHMLDGGKRMGHGYSIFLCAGHHRGIWSPLQLIQLLPEQRVSISDGRKRFVLIFGTERSLWERVQVTINDPTEWPKSKILQRRIHG